MNEESKNWIEGILGEDWRTKVWGFISTITVAIAAYPDSVAFLPDSIEGYVKGIAGLVSFYTGKKFIDNVADKKATEDKLKTEVSKEVSKEVEKKVEEIQNPIV